jgi:uncharacterized short protein YbdD (DUF466 family)
MTLKEAVIGVRSLLREATGEAKWDEYVERCRRDGDTPMSRREFERHRAEHRERNPQARCC